MMTYVWWFVFGTLMVLILFGGQIASLVSSMWTRKKETTQSGAGAGASSAGAAPGSGGDRWAHNPPSEMYGGVPQIKWIKPWYEATLFAFAILALLVGGVFILITFLSGWQSVINLLEWGASGMPLSRGAMAVPVLVTIGAVVHKSIRIVPTALAIVAVILGSSIYGWNWWKIPNNCQGMCDPVWMGVTAPIAAVVLPMIFLTLYALWKSRWEDWDVPIVMTVAWFFVFRFIQAQAIT